ncbi:MAG: hypothetical protein AAF824_25780, partial [Bacteroidota bacterium]
LSTKAMLEIKNGEKEASAKTLAMTLAEKATPVQLYQMGNGLLSMEEVDLAVQTFNALSEKFPDNWLSHLGVGAGQKAKGEMQKARDSYKKALETAPAGYKGFIQSNIDSLEG